MKATTLCLFLVMMGTVMAQAPAKRSSTEASMQVFWEKFKTAVIKRDKAAVANLSQFPIGMPYLQKDIKTRADLSKRYRAVFNQETDAAKCFSKARPEIDSTLPKEFYVACSYPDGGGERPLVYYFTLTRSGWRFFAFDNINE